jgi:hypothetical protein
MALQTFDHWNVADAETENEPVAVKRFSETIALCAVKESRA